MTDAPAWAIPYVGTPYIPHERECWHFVTEVLAAQFGITDLPIITADADPRQARRLFDAHPERHAWTEVTDEPPDGDLVLMRKGTRPCHIGHRAAPFILHSLQGSGAILTSPDRLVDLGYHVVGHFRRSAP